MWHSPETSMRLRRQIVCTIGPAVASRERIAELIAAGMTWHG
jgi:pyruvate kinase